MKFNFDFIKNKKIYFIISAVIVSVSILATFVLGVKLDIQFKGGTILTFLYDGEIEQAEFEKTAVDALGGLGVTSTVGEDFSSGRNRIQLSLISNAGLSSDKQIELTNSISEKYAGNSIELLESSDVSPSSGKEFFLKCIVAVILSFIVLILYIAIRFKNIGGWIAGVCAVITLVHDCVVVYGSFVIFGMSIDANFMAVILTILGYSINDTIVIYDRVRENEILYRKSKTRAEIINLSINQSLTRSINTSLTTIMAMLVVTIIAAIYGVNSIFSFSFPMMIGMICGVYSSVCFACPLWYIISTKMDSKKKNKHGKRRAHAQY